MQEEKKKIKKNPCTFFAFSSSYLFRNLEFIMEMLKLEILFHIITKCLKLYKAKSTIRKFLYEFKLLNEKGGETYNRGLPYNCKYQIAQKLNINKKKYVK